MMIIKHLMRINIQSINLIQLLMKRRSHPFLN